MKPVACPSCRPPAETASSASAFASSPCPARRSTSWASSTVPGRVGVPRLDPCAPVNELGVVYLFGVLHEAFDFEIESIQAGFPDCIARRRLSDERWEEVRIEFEFRSRSFVAHGHDPAGVDVIVCWRHDWPGCPATIEVIELSTILTDTEQIAAHVTTEKRLTAWQEACRMGRLEGLTFTEIARRWKNRRPDARSPGSRRTST